MRVRVVRWRSGELHNRYVLTDVGGISFGQGLDQASDTAQQEDVVTLLDKGLAEELLQGFIGSPPKYTRDMVEVVLIGSQGDLRISADDWAARMQTIAYTVVCGVGPRVPRRYS